MPSLEKTWRHVTATCGNDGTTGGYGLTGDAGETVKSFGGWAEYVLLDNSNESSTSEDYSKDAVPISLLALDYDSVTDKQEAVIGFKAAPWAKVRIHMWIVTD